MNSRKYLIAFILIIVAVAVFAIPFLVKAGDSGKPTDNSDRVESADDINDPTGTVNFGDDVVFFTDEDADGLFERNNAKVSMNPTETAEFFHRPLGPGQRVTLWIQPHPKSRIRTAYEVWDVKRGRALGQYEALVTSNH